MIVRIIKTDSIMKIKAPAKINLHLEILGQRNDDFHELAMVLQSIDLFDSLEITNNQNGVLTLTSNNKSLAIDKENLIIKAAELLKRESGLKDLGASIHLTKNIPIGAGLAGGSSDCAAALLGLNQLWNLSFSSQELIKFSSELGSDIPFCFSGGTQLCFGRGEKLERLQSITEKVKALILVKDPSVSVSTPWAYSRYKELKGSNYLKSEIQFEERRIELRNASWLKCSNTDKKQFFPLQNDLQTIVSAEIKAVDRALKLLTELPGSLGVAMSGSGPSCFALFPSFQEAKSVLMKNCVKFESIGLESWCCSLLPHGVEIKT